MRLDSAENPLIKHLAKLVKDKEYRYQERCVVIEGSTMVGEIALHAPINKMLAVDESLFPKNFHGEKIIVSPRLIEKICHTKTPEGIIAEIPMPEEGNLLECRSLLVLDRIADPGNLGTLLRTALGLGWEGAFLLSGCCDAFNDKSLRAAKGATFRLKLRQGGWNELKEMFSKGEWQILRADLHGEVAEKIPRAKKRALILGSESQGISQEARQLSSPVTIPIHNIDSLNVAVAGGILMAQLLL